MGDSYRRGDRDRDIYFAEPGAGRQRHDLGNVILHCAKETVGTRDITAPKGGRN